MKWICESTPPGTAISPSPGDHLRARTDHDVDAGLHVRITTLADRKNTAVFQPNIGFDDAPVIDDERVRDDGVDGFGVGALALAHAVADHLAAAELHLFAVDGAIGFDGNEQLRVGEPDAIADGRAVHGRVGRAIDARHEPPPSAPMTRP